DGSGRSGGGGPLREPHGALDPPVGKAVPAPVELGQRLHQHRLVADRLEPRGTGDPVHARGAVGGGDAAQRPLRPPAPARLFSRPGPLAASATACPPARRADERHLQPAHAADRRAPGRRAEPRRPGTPRLLAARARPASGVIAVLPDRATAPRFAAGDRGTSLGNRLGQLAALGFAARGGPAAEAALRAP